MIKILWDFGIINVSLVVSDHHGIAIFLEDTSEKILLIVVSCSADINVAEKENEKVEKYQ